LSAYCWSRY